jgi:hypothetical protein
MSIQLNQIPVAYAVPTAGILFQLDRTATNRQRLTYIVTELGGLEPLTANDWLPTTVRDGFISNGPNKAPLAHASWNGRVVIPADALEGELAAQLALGGAAAERRRSVRNQACSAPAKYLM